jgi:hypothetical protein
VGVESKLFWVSVNNMAKDPEEGEIWEWRAFGTPSVKTIETVRSHPIRMGVKDLPGEDIYLISPISDQNVKLRMWRGEWVLKIKLLLTTAPRGIDLYTETAGMVYKFPSGPDVLAQAARLLGVKLSALSESADAFSSDEFIEALAQSSPPVVTARTVKLRSQFDFSRAWVELAEVEFPRNQVQTLSVHSTTISAVEEILDVLSPNPELEVMNYVEACRRWG